MRVCSKSGLEHPFYTQSGLWFVFRSVAWWVVCIMGYQNNKKSAIHQYPPRHSLCRKYTMHYPTSKETLLLLKTIVNMYIHVGLHILQQTH